MHVDTLRQILKTGTVKVTYTCPACNGTGRTAMRYQCRECWKNFTSEQMSALPASSETLPCGCDWTRRDWLGRSEGSNLSEEDYCLDCIGDDYNDHGKLTETVALADLLRALSPVEDEEADDIDQTASPDYLCRHCHRPLDPDRIFCDREDCPIVRMRNAKTE